MADTPTARNAAGRWDEARRSERSAEQTPIVVIKGGAEGDPSARHARGKAHDTFSVHQLPVPALQLDASRLRALFAGLKTEGDAEHVLRNGMWQGGISHAGLFVADANEMAARLLQAASSEDLVGPASYLFAASPETARRLVRASLDGAELFSEPMKMRSFKGVLLDVKLSISFPSPERLDRLVVVLDDITERRQAGEYGTDPLHMARLSTLGRLSASISHEVNQPLSAIVNDCETAVRHLSRQEPNLAKVSELAARIAASAHQASEIVKRVRGMASSQPNTRIPLDLNDIVTDALSFIRHEIDMQGICLSLACRPRLPVFLGDRVQMQQVIVNLLVNAIEAVASSKRHPRRIEIATVDAGHRIQLSIRDSGDGISNVDLARIFDCFYTTKEDGVGIGLSICQSIVLDHGGDISAANHGDAGALFSVSLPVHRGG